MLVSATLTFLVILISVLITINFGNTDTKNLTQNEQAAQALDSYVPLTDTGSGNGLFVESDFDSTGGILAKVFKWMIVIALVLAILYIVLGSIQYMTTDAVFEKKEGLTKIQSAIAGLILALISWLILNQINSSITSMRLFIPSAGPIGGNVSPTPPGGGSANEAD